MDLSLAFQVQRKKEDSGTPDGAPTLNGCLASYTAEEQLAPADYTCSECSAKGATKQLRLKKLPIILGMQLKVSKHFISALSEPRTNLRSVSKPVAPSPKK